MWNCCRCLYEDKQWLTLILLLQATHRVETGAVELICSLSSCRHKTRRSCTLQRNPCFPPAPHGLPALCLSRLRRSAPCGIRCTALCQWGGPLLPSSPLSEMWKGDNSYDSTLPPTGDNKVLQGWIELRSPSAVRIWLRSFSMCFSSAFALVNFFVRHQTPCLLTAVLAS